MDRSIRQQRLVQKHADKALFKAVVAAVEAALADQRQAETQRQLGNNGNGSNGSGSGSR